MLADFTITIHEDKRPRAVQVKVHDNVAALRSASTKYDRSWPGMENNPSLHAEQETLGICHRFHIADYPLCAIVRLAPPHIGAGIVAHELTHAAVWLWELKHEFKDTRINCENDEWFAWILGELVCQTTNKLYEHGVYSKLFA